MKTTIINVFLAIFTVLAMASCSNSGGKDMTKDPKYADVYNHFFFPTQTLYYYDYTSPNGKSGKFLSVEKAMPNAKLIEEIQPGKSRLVITKVLEIEGKNQTPQTIVEGRLHKDEISQPQEFKATWDDVNRGLKK